MSLPQTLDFSSVKPQGLPTQIKFQKFYPQAYNQSIASTDQIRFIINQNGFWDPYNTYIVIEVDAKDMTSDFHQQLDGSAHSFISELVISVGNKEIEPQMLYDVHFSHSGRDQRMHEGLGSLSQQNGDFQTNPCNNLFGAVNTFVTPFEVLTATSFGYNFDYAPPKSQYKTVTKWKDVWNGLASQYYAPAYGLGRVFDTGETTGDTTGKKLEVNPYTQRVDDWFLKQKKTSPYFGQHSDNVNMIKVDNFCGTSFEPVFSKKVEQIGISNGKYGQSMSQTKYRFQIPLLSSIFGVLLPREAFKYIPLKYFKDLTLDFRLNPYALFTSGYKNQTSTDADTIATWDIGQVVGNMPARSYSLSKFEIWTDLMVFDDTTQNAVDQQFSNGITLYSQAFQLGPLYQLKDTSSCQGTFQVNQGFESLKSIIIRYLLNDYQTYSFCRKSMYVSSNLQFLQARVGLDYYPQLPIEGHAGCPYPNTSGQCNADFLVQMLKCFGKLHDIDQSIYVNIHNMAPNERVYDVTNISKFTSGTYEEASGTVDITNRDTKRGYSFLYENFCVSKALFGINTEGLSNDNTRISGINTMGTRPFDIIIKTDSSSVTALKDRPRTMYIWMHYDFMLRISPNGFDVLGRS